MTTRSDNDNTGPLAGIKVVDLTRFQAGPICTMLLGDMGAEVIKVEEVGSGDHGRDYEPSIDGISAFFAAYNRNKKSITLNLKAGEGRELLRKLVQWGDVLVDNFRPGVMARLGFSYDEVRQINPGIIMVACSGFGQEGPYAGRASFDMVAQAMSGVMSVTGNEGGVPTRAGPAIADSTGGFFGAMGAILALFHKQKTGEGQFVDVSLLDGQLLLMSFNLIRAYLGVELKPGATQVAPADSYPTADGRFIYIFGHDNSHFPRLCRLAGRPEMADDPRFSSRVKRFDHRHELNEMVAQWTRTMTADALEAAVAEVGLPYGRVNEVAEVLEDPHIRARGTLVEVDHHGKGTLPLVDVYPKLSKTPGAIRTPCPLLGEHNEEVYCGLLDLSKEELKTLQEQGVV
jgi:crotonobetainyl-CoA:carnitine CoA-transferase CaiB-like acyl-CoA transferase